MRTLATPFHFHVFLSRKSKKRVHIITSQTSHPRNNLCSFGANVKFVEDEWSDRVHAHHLTTFRCYKNPLSRLPATVERNLKVPVLCCHFPSRAAVHGSRRGVWGWEVKATARVARLNKGNQHALKRLA
jgi:hypothetical protein